MSKNSYPYPPDEFDSVNPSNRPQEVHAARRTTWSRVWPFVVVVIAVPAIAFAVMKVLSSWDNAQTAAPDEPTTTTTQTLVVTDPPTAPQDDPATQGEVPPADIGGETPSTNETQDEADAPPIDRTVAVMVLNAKGEQGVAGRASDLLRQDGWTQVNAENYEGTEIEGASCVYYGKNVWSTSAESVAGILQIDRVEKDVEGSPDGITVILRQDFIL